MFTIAMENLGVDYVAIFGYMVMLIAAGIGAGMFVKFLKHQEQKDKLESEKWQHRTIQDLRIQIADLEEKNRRQASRIRDYEYGDERPLSDYNEGDQSGADDENPGPGFNNGIPAWALELLKNPSVQSIAVEVAKHRPELIKELMDRFIPARPGSAPNTPPILPQNSNNQPIVQG